MGVSGDVDFTRGGKRPRGYAWFCFDGGGVHCEAPSVLETQFHAGMMRKTPMRLHRGNRSRCSARTVPTPV
ncbi:unnamed protein product [Ciceribacter selenitireducens ATCC BAA-1503]|uniref:Uncharacterized protein n=1 Tax=Ciceribacter selenitireducens ATCC BAA-1503 TaxID=1336235 RepID=A0A376AEJ0_9HYPH|nr:unnamed protein product [Ciceribacter selenitireducens ATCC BAA-1503]